MVPISWRWQEVEDLQMIDKFIFGGVLGAITGRHLDKNLDSGFRFYPNYIFKLPPVL